MVVVLPTGSTRMLFHPSRDGKDKDSKCLFTHLEAWRHKNFCLDTLWKETF